MRVPINPSRAFGKPPNLKKGGQPKIYIGGIFSDGGGIIISPDQWGRPHFKRVPPWQPDVMRLSVAANLVAGAKKISSRATRKQMQTLAEKIVMEALPGIQSRM